MTLYRYDRIRVARSQVCDGLGVFATAPIARGELTLTERVVIVPAAEVTTPSLFFDEYIFEWGDDDAAAAVPIGISMLINHGPEGAANLTWRENGEFIEWTALRDIAEGEELLHNYNGRGSAEPREFDPR